jgi:hypothetical protein
MGTTFWQRITGTSRICRASHLYLKLGQMLCCLNKVITSHWRETDDLGDVSRDAPFF